MVTQTAEVTSTEAMFPADEASRAPGIELLEHGEGPAAVRMTVTPAMVNGHGGGCLFLLADTAFACACNSHGPVTVAAGAASSSSRPRTRATSPWRGPGNVSDSAAAACT
jgi:acyl-CoA thioesterase